jgi:glycine cleavage system H lipoate-binding protein
MIVESTMENIIETKEEYKFPTDRRYNAEHHMWAKHVEGHILVGIDSLGLESMGDLAYVVILPPGTKVKRGQSFGSMEAAKMT